MDANGWAIIIAACGLVLQQLYKMGIDYRREQEKIKRDAEVAKKVEAVKTTLESNTVTVKEVKADLKANTATTEKIEKQTNGAAEARDKRIAAIEEKVADLNGYVHVRHHDFLGEFDAIRRMLKVLSVKLGLEELEPGPEAQEAPSPLSPKEKP